VVYIEFGGSWGELGGVPRSSEELVRFGSH
jgi:hypothetical protein